MNSVIIQPASTFILFCNLSACIVIASLFFSKITEQKLADMSDVTDQQVCAAAVPLFAHPLTPSLTHPLLHSLNRSTNYVLCLCTCAHVQKADALKEKEAGTAAYKNKDFDTALKVCLHFHPNR